MLELYTLTWTPQGLVFTPRQDEALCNALSKKNILGYAVPRVLGDTQLLSCSVLRQEKGQGGLFIVEDDMERLMAVVAESNLAYLEGLKHFAEMVEHTRYAADIFEHSEDEE